MKLTVLNPKGNDPEQYFGDYAGQPDPLVHAPVNYHAYAACTGGSFQRDVKKAISISEPILMLIRRDLKLCLKTAKAIKASGVPLAVCLKETGFHQFHQLLETPNALANLKTILDLADHVISPTLEMKHVFEGLSKTPCHFVLTPYPINDERWNKVTATDQREGIFIGTRELKTASRNHLQSLILLKTFLETTPCPVTVINKDKRLNQFLDTIDFPKRYLSILPPQNYLDYLEIVSKHRVTFQLDISQVPGQVAGDCSLCQTICIGGNGTIDQVIFPQFSSVNLNRIDLLNTLNDLMTDELFYKDAVSKSVDIAKSKLSYEIVSEELNKIFS